MAAKIRLQQTGSANRRLYRIVVVDEHKKRGGAVIEIIGHINPFVKPVKVDIDDARLKYWRSKGVQLTEGAAKIITPAA